MPKTLKALIQASGNTGSAGQSFRNHVTGAVTGARMSEYSRTGWDLWSQSATTVPHNTNVNFWFNFIGPNLNVGRYANIIRPIAVSPLLPADPGTLNATLVGTNLDATGGQSTVTVNFTGKGKHGTYSSSGSPSVTKNYWKDYSGTLQSPGDEPASGYDATWEIGVTYNAGIYTPPVLGSNLLEIDIFQPADAGNFNGELTERRSVTVGEYDAGAPSGSMEEGRFFTNVSDPAGSLVDTSDYAWYDLDLYVSPGGYHYMRFTVGPQSGFQYGRVYYQWRNSSGGSWSSPIQIEWWDTRAYSSYPGV
jgi:hypothetical protein